MAGQGGPSHLRPVRLCHHPLEPAQEAHQNRLQNPLGHLHLNPPYLHLPAPVAVLRTWMESAVLPTWQPRPRHPQPRQNQHQHPSAACARAMTTVHDAIIVLFTSTVQHKTAVGCQKVSARLLTPGGCRVSSHSCDSGQAQSARCPRQPSQHIPARAYVSSPRSVSRPGPSRSPDRIPPVPGEIDWLDPTPVCPAYQPGSRHH